jgi:cobaltochelatase CobS
MATTPATGKFELDDFVAAAMSEFAKRDDIKTTDLPTIKTATAAAAVVEHATPTAFEVKLGRGEVEYSKLFGSVPKNIPDFGVAKFVGIPECVTHLIPRVDDKYVVQVEEAARLVSAMMDGDKVLMSGPTGSGKSSLVKYVCAKLGAPFIRINMSADAESSVLFGQLVARDGATVWEDGPITEAVKHGAVVLIDEWELMPPEIAMGLQNLLEDDGYLFLKEKPGDAKDKTFIPHPNFRIVCAGNTVGQGDDSGGFAGTMVQNSATLDRFTTTIHLDYLSKEHEMDVIRGKAGVSNKEAEQMIKLASLVRAAYGQRSINLTMSPRTLINWGSKAVKHGDMRQSFRIAFYDKLRDSDKRAVSELYAKVFGVAI